MVTLTVGMIVCSYCQDFLVNIRLIIAKKCIKCIIRRLCRVGLSFSLGISAFRTQSKIGDVLSHKLRAVHYCPYLEVFRVTSTALQRISEILSRAQPKKDNKWEKHGRADGKRHQDFHEHQLQVPSSLIPLSLP
jgi:hypothetical protein